MKSASFKAIVFVALAIALPGCASKRGFDRGAAGNQLREAAPAVSDQDIKDAFEIKPQLKYPFKLAMFLNGGGWNWRWTGEDKDSFLALEKRLVQDNLVSKVILITPSDLETPECGSKCRVDLKSIRLAAARYGADAVLVVNGTADTDRYNNILGPTYVLLLPMVFVPGTQLDALFMANCKLWDVRNQYLYFSAEAEGEAGQTRPTMFIEGKHAIEKAKRAAVAGLKEEILGRFKSIAGN